MTLSEIVALKGKLTRYDRSDMDGENPSLAEQIASINWALRSLSRQIEPFDASIVLSLSAGVDSYDLRTACSRKVVRAMHVVIAGRPLLDASGRRCGLWTLQELQRYRSEWRTDPASTPSAAVQLGTTLVLNPKPAQAIVDAGNHFIAGTYLAADMNVADMERSPELPEELHECLAYLAAERAMKPMTSEAEAWQRLSAIHAEWFEQVERIRRENENRLASWGTTPGTTGEGDYLWL